ncbi:hypothetical protein P22_2037 [Propionispora sp. 2/2-37]|uniref:zinc ribbon domain-containing protein n=1 Tax=Propionispora sp. 2/2-37 TaxID=1677858 RepID=UPI0006BB5CDB|nr:zinc ribbon domain-containing protein [Propionispora sp. 2/2-37]CUH95949.1 hypothetical protein P22_2037 [Propionispora sp. 2/2-37]
MLQFCPVCGEKLPQAGTVKFCPGCGQKLADFLVPEAPLLSSLPEVPRCDSDIAHQYPVKNYADALRYYDEFIAERQRQGLDQETIRRQAGEFFSRLKQQLPQRSAMTVRKAKAVRPCGLLPDQVYSIVLKSVGSNKERLIQRLSRVLRRSRTAVRMAVDLVPGIIVYKSYKAEVQAVLGVLQEEQLYFTLIPGEFAADVRIESLVFQFETLDHEARQLLRRVPQGFWLGETIQLVASEIEREGELDILVVTGQALYLFGRRLAAGQQPEAYIIPYSQLAEILMHQDGGDGELELVYKEYGREDWLRFDSEVQLMKVYQYVKTILAE